MRHGFKTLWALVVLFWGVNLPAQAGLYNPQTFTLENGLKVVVVENHRAPVVGQFLWFKVGSGDDPHGKSGLAHYLEHLRFKGPQGSASAEIFRLVEEVGGQQNASTSFDFTNYYQVVAAPHLERVMKLEAQRMRGLQCLPEQAKTELKVILEERRMRTDNSPMGKFMEAVGSLFYRHDPRRLPVIGWPHEIEGLTLKDANAFYKNWYAPGNAVLVLVGDVTLAQAKTLAKKHYGAVPARPLPVRMRVEEPFEVEANVRLEMDAPDIQAPYLVRTYRAPSFEVEKGRFLYVAQVLENLLSTTPTGFLYRELVEVQKMATSVSASYNVLSFGPSDLTFILQPGEKISLTQLESVLEKTLADFLKRGLTQEDLDKAKNRMLATLIYNKDSALSGNDLGYGLALGLPLEELDRWDEKIQAVTLEEVAALAQKILSNPHHFTGTLVPKAPMPSGESS